MSQPSTVSNECVVISVDAQGVAQVRLSRPGKLNALDSAMFDAIIAAGECLAAMDELRCVVLSGEGKGFCAGLDLALLGTLAGSDLQLARRTHGHANSFQQVAMQWRALPVPPASLAKYLDGWGRSADAGLVALDEHGEPIGAAWYRQFEPDKRGEGILAGDLQRTVAVVIQTPRSLARG